MPDPQRDGGRSLTALQIVVFVDLLGLTLVLPSLPFRAAELGGNGLWLGVVLAGYSVAQAVAAPLLGRWADRHGRRRLLLLALLGSTGSLVVMGVAGSLWMLLAARVLAGACGGSIGVAHALAADLTTPERRTMAMGRLGMAIGAAFTVGPLLGALAGPFGFTAASLAGAAVAAAGLFAAWRLLPVQARPVAEHRPPPSQNAGSIRLRTPWRLIVAGFAGMAAFVGMESTIAFLAERRFDAGPGFVGVTLFVGGAALTLVQAGILARAARRWGDRSVGAAGALLMVVGMIALPLSGMAAGFLVAVALVAAGQGLLSATAASLLSRAGPPERRGELLGRGQSAAATGRIVGPVTAGALFDVAPVLPFALGAALAATAAGLVAGDRSAKAAARTTGSEPPNGRGALP